MQIRKKSFAVAFLAATLQLTAQIPGTAVTTGTHRFLGPTLGFVPGATPSQLQPIWGIAGVARLGDPILLPSTVTSIYLAPGHLYALVAQGAADSIALVILRDRSGRQEAIPVLTTVSGAIARPDLIAFSPTGNSAVLYSLSTNRLQVLTGLPASPRVARDSSNLQIPNGVSKVAISDDAQSVLIADEGGAVYAIWPNANALPVYHSPHLSALVFVPRSNNAILSDPGTGTAVLLSAFGPNPSVKTLPAAAAEGCQPEAVTSTADGNTVILACPAQHLIWSVDLNSGTANIHKVDNVPTGFESIGARNTFLLTPPDNGTYWLMSWHAEGPEISFIGAVHESEQGTGN